MTWVLVIGVWLLLATLVAIVIGRSLRLADVRAAEAAEDAPDVVVRRPVTGKPAGTVLPFRAAATDAARPSRPARETPTIPGIPVARPPAPGARGAGSQSDSRRSSGLG